MVELKPLIGISPVELIIQLINTFLVFFILSKLLFKPVLGIIEAREKEIQSNLAEGERTKAEGEKFRKERQEESDERMKKQQENTDDNDNGEPSSSSEA